MSAVIRPARQGDAASIGSLLEANHLPVDGVTERIATTLVAVEGSSVVGTAALETFPDGALLRSVAVASGRQGSGLGRELVRSAMTLAADRAMPAVYLLTTTAEHYFPRFGFERIERSSVPSGVRQSVEFTSACPASAVVMTAPLARKA